MISLKGPIALLFPGQGVQKPGMGRNLYDRYPAARAIESLPRLLLGARGAQHPVSQRNDEAGLFGERDEIVGLDHAAGRMLPADERFESGNDAGRDFYDRLVVDDELLALERLTHVALQRQLAHRSVVDFGGVELDIVPAFVLCLVHRRVRVLDERVDVGAVVRVDGNTDARRYKELVIVDDERIVERRDDLVRDGANVRFACHVGQHDDELVASRAGDGIARTHGAR